MSEETTIPRPVYCDFCRTEHRQVEATYDAQVKGRSSWAFMCEEHFKRYGPDELGTGRGQRLVVAQ